MAEPVLVERRGSAGHITLARPEQRNPLDRETGQAILDGLRQHLGDPEVRSVVIAGQGEAFCAGADLKQARALPDLPSAQAFAWPEPLIEAQLEMLDAAKPVLAAVHGPAYAGGMGLAGMCDVILATRVSSFAMPEVKIGLFPMIIVAQLARALPRKRLLEMMFTGNPMGAEEAYALGFVNRVVEDRAALDAAVAEYVATFEKVSPNAIRMGRRAFSVMSEIPPGMALRAAQFFNVPFFMGDDFREGTAAFLDKRRPGWIAPPQDD